MKSHRRGLRLGWTDRAVLPGVIGILFLAAGVLPGRLSPPPVVPSGTSLGSVDAPASGSHLAGDAASWTADCIDCPRDLFAVGDQSAAFDPAGRLHVVYVGDHVYHATRVEGRWQVEIVDEGSGLTYAPNQPPPSVAIDDTGVVHLAYVDATGGIMRYAAGRDGHWLREDVDAAPEGERLYSDTSIALDSAGRPHMAFTNHGILKYATRSSAAWDVDVIEPAAWAEMYTSLALDHQDRPHVSFFYAHGDDTFMRYAVRDGSEWTIETVDRAKFVGEFNSIDLDSSGRPHLSYLDVTGERLKYARRLDSGWVVEPVDVSTWFGGFSSIALDSQDRPVISYSRENEIRVARFDGQQWDLATIGGRSWYTAMVLDSADNPHVFVFNWNYRTLWHMESQGPGRGWSGDRVDSVVRTGLYVDAAADEDGFVHVSYTDETDHLLRYARETPHGWALSSLGPLGPGGGFTSVAVDPAARPHIAYFDAADQSIGHTRLGPDGLWATTRVDGVSDQVTAISLALDQAAAHVVYRPSSGPLRYGRLALPKDGVASAATEWITETVELAAVPGDYVDLAVDRRGRPHILYGERDAGLHYAVRVGDSWVDRSVDDTASSEYEVALALDAVDRPHVAFAGPAGGSLHYATLAGGEFSVEPIPEVDEIGRYLTMAVDERNRPHLAITHRGGGLRYGLRGSHGWDVATVADGYRMGDHASLVISPAGPTIVYQDGEYFDLKIARPERVDIYLPAAWSRVAASQR